MKPGKIIHSIVILWMCSTAITQAQIKVEPGDHFPDWKEGYMDIHHISTGKGESVFVLMPDGTTMMIDAGETGTDKRNFKPDSTRSSGEWISRYVLRMMRPLTEKKLDYILLTHFHDDHMGNIQLTDRKSKKGDYLLTGITEVGELLPFGKIVDRNWPDYNYPFPMSDVPNLQNYIRFVNWQVKNGAKVEMFDAGSNQQFKLRKKADKYPGFEIRNIAVNGEVWTGVHNNTRKHFPPIESLSKEEYPEENALSAAILISYGNFDYYNGGDIVHTYSPGTWMDIETPVGLATGPLDVCEVNHHGKDAMGKGFIQAVRPRVFVMQAFALSHPDALALKNMLSQTIYPGERDVFTTHLFEANRMVLGKRLVGQLKCQQGHIVIRVYQGGDKYEIYILDDTTESFQINAIHGPYESR